MSFINQFYTILKNPKVIEESNKLFSEGKNDKLFIDYFGVNYNEENIVSVKFYFSFLNIFPSDDLFRDFNLDENTISIIKSNWKTSDKFEYLHQGFTFGLKCYVKKGKVIINKYIHFRTKEFINGLPKSITLQDSDQNNFPGICIENHPSKIEHKNYFYVTSKEAKTAIFQMFDLNNSGLDLNEIYMFEYTESEIEKKINIILPESASVKKYLEKNGNNSILELSSYFFTKHQLYYFAPGIRLDSSTKAIYFLPKQLFYEFTPVNCIKNVISLD